jgi:N-acetylneuraminate synthase/sialic acid synthase
MGDGQKRQFESEKDPLRKMGKKLVISRAMKTGEVLTASDVAFRSPADGLAPYMVEKFIGKQLVHDVLEEHILAIEDVR